MHTFKLMHLLSKLIIKDNAVQYHLQAKLMNMLPYNSMQHMQVARHGNRIMFFVNNDRRITQ